MLLDARGIRVAFGGVVAVNDVSLALDDRETVGIVGPNGSGKTSFLNAITGVVPATGSLSVKGVAVPLGHPAASRGAGILRLFQTPQVYKELTCIENVLLSTPDRGMTGLVGAWLARPTMWRREHQRWEAAAAVLDRVGLLPLARASAAMLPYGQQRLLDLARALAARPAALLLDEPSAGLNRYETERLAELCNELRGDGLSLMVIDHKVDFIETISDRVAVLELGRLIASGTAAEVWRDARVMEAYLGLTSRA
jgi:ABC-type branched-subunit amino acid transport system ATPase component